MIRARQFDQLGVSNPFGHVPRVAHVDRGVAHSMQDQRRHADTGQDVTYIDVAQHIDD